MLAIIVALALAATATGAGDDAPVIERAAVPDGIGSRVVIHGCQSEDSCAIDYRGSRSGGKWIIRRYVP